MVEPISFYLLCTLFILLLHNTLKYTTRLYMKQYFIVGKQF